MLHVPEPRDTPAGSPTRTRSVLAPVQSSPARSSVRARTRLLSELPEAAQWWFVCYDV
jgi:hypothetical protein